MQIAVGDHIRASISGEVVARDGNIVAFPNGIAVDLNCVHAELLPHPKPEVGAVLNAPRIRNIWWKRGTIIRPLSGGTDTQKQHLHCLVLAHDAYWYQLDDTEGYCYSFASLVGSYKVVHIA